MLHTTGSDAAYLLSETNWNSNYTGPGVDACQRLKYSCVSEESVKGPVLSAVRRKAVTFPRRSSWVAKRPTNAQNSLETSVKQTTLAPRDCLAFTCKTHPVGWQTFLNLLFSPFWRIFLKFLTLTCLQLHSSTDWVGTLGLSGMCWRDRLRQRRPWGGCSSVTGRRRWLCAELATRPFHSPVTTRCRAKTLSELAALFSFSKIKHADSTLPPKTSPLFLIKFLSQVRVSQPFMLSFFFCNSNQCQLLSL